MASTPANAGRTCDKKGPSVQIVEKGMALALKTAQTLDADYAAHSTKVVIIASAGQDLGKYGLRYSHFVIAQNEATWLGLETRIARPKFDFYFGESG